MNKDLAPADMYKNAVNVGTEEVSTEDINTPILKIVQSNTTGIEGKKEGSFYRSDTGEQLESVDVVFTYVTTQEVENYNKDGMDKVKVYFGFYKDTKEAFKMYCRGWAIASHRAFQTEVLHLKQKYGVPMLALTVRLTTELQKGTIPDSGKPYETYKPVFTIVKDETGKPVFEMNAEKISFYVEAVNRFKQLALTPSITDEAQNEVEPAIVHSSPEDEQIADEVDKALS